MKIEVALSAFAMLLAGPSAIMPCSSAACATSTGYACCKVCKVGKACGDSCISKVKECHTGQGCACDG